MLKIIGSVFFSINQINIFSLLNIYKIAKTLKRFDFVAVDVKQKKKKERSIKHICS